MKRFLFIGLIITLILSACSAAVPQIEEASGDDHLAVVYAESTWGCCGDWTEYLKENGFTTELNEQVSLAEIKQKYQVPGQLQSCHTAIVNGYVIEGHVPIAEINRLLKEKPDVIGIAVPGMPMGSPGMDIEGFDSEAYDVVTFDREGNIEIYSSYPAE